jgi:hypothetical protein
LLVVALMNNALCFVRDGTTCSCCQVSKICIVFGYEFQHIPFKCVGISDTDEGWMLKESHTYEKRPTKMQQASHNQQQTRFSLTSIN